MDLISCLLSIIRYQPGRPTLAVPLPIRLATDWRHSVNVSRHVRIFRTLFYDDRVLGCMDGGGGVVSVLFVDVRRSETEYSVRGHTYTEQGSHSAIFF